MNHLIEKKATCPHCWNNFYSDHALYISQHQNLMGDPILGDVAKRFTPHEATRDRHGKVFDSKGWEMIERACPRCHLQIPGDILVERPKFISIVGAPMSGKTYFLIVMLHELKKTLARQFRYTLDICDSHDKDLFARSEEKLFYSHNPETPVFLEKTEEFGKLYSMVTLDEVKVQLPKPFTFTCRSTADNSEKTNRSIQQSVVLYDNAGESFYFGQGRDGSIRSTQHLGESDAVLFAYDFLLDPKAKTRLASCSNDPQLTKQKNIRQQEILTEVIHQMRKHSRTPETSRLSATLVVCVQKYDVWKPLLDHCKSLDGEPLIDHTSVEYFKHHGVAGLDIQEINVISHSIRLLIQDICPEFVAAAEANFSKVRYFPVSALGRSPIEDGEFLKIAPYQLQPFRVEHPMLWLFREWNLVSRASSKVPNPKGLPEGIIRRCTPDRLSVSCPETGELFVLDHDYANAYFFNPDTGQYFWIPQVPQPSQKTGSPPNSARSEANSQDSLKLQLKSNQPKKKKGWFGLW
jgi:hypothetical protein